MQARMEARMKNPAMALPGVSDAIQGLVKAACKGGVSPRTLELVQRHPDQCRQRADAVPDDVWDEAAAYYDDKGLAALILWIATTTTFFNRLNSSIKEPAGATWG
jgi:hypothetical protein